MKTLRKLFFGIFLAHVFFTEAVAHGMTAEIQAIATLALVEKCQKDQPQLSKKLESVTSAWSERNKQYVSAVRALPENELRSAIDMMRDAYDQEGTYSLEVCRKAIESIQDPERDIKPD
jgi:ElaB/YqjD/DUF883 family membrane-anchored ribosome-binding protein